jgi:hypothetical protein
MAHFRLVLGFLVAATGSVYAGGSPENALIVIDPSNPESLYIGNYYKNARNIPDQNVLYIDPNSPDYRDFAVKNLDALFAHLASKKIEDHIDYIIVTPGTSFYVNAVGLISDQCSQVRRFAVGSAFTTAFIRGEVLSGLPSTTTNRFFRNANDAHYFDSSVRFWSGLPSTLAQGRRYFIGAMLGYSGERGNTVQEIIDMIDRSVAVDGTHPAGTFYFMQTTDNLRSGPRHDLFPTVVQAIRDLGGQAEHLFDVLPIGRHDCLGIMTGWASPGIDGANMTILPGAFCDHLTSWAGMFDNASQEKMSRWIVKGASGSWGAVEEPCNYSGKFPSARMHLFYFQGLTLGEAVFRSAGFVPFQLLLYGDPLTRPFAAIPTVNVSDVPGGQVSGTITLTPSGVSGIGNILRFDLMVNGMLHSSVAPGGQFRLDTTSLPDGWNEIRVLAFDDTTIRNVGRWVGSLNVNNHNRAVNIVPSTTTGNLTTLIEFNLSASGGNVAETQLIQNGRVVAAASQINKVLSVFGRTLGAGMTKVHARVIFEDGYVAISSPVQLSIDFNAGTPTGNPPVAFSYTKRVSNVSPSLVELPATDDSGLPLTYQIITSPTQATLESNFGGPYRLVRPNQGATGSDTMTFRVTNTNGQSNIATVLLIYTLQMPRCPTSFNVLRGTLISGVLGDVIESDDKRIDIRQRFPFLVADPNVQVIFETTSGVRQIGKLVFKMESNCNAIPSGNILQRTELFNYETNQWEVVDERSPTPNDSITEVTITSNPSRFVRDITGDIRVRASWFDRGVAIPTWNV